MLTELDPRFLAQITRLQDVSASVANTTTNIEHAQRSWQNPDDNNGAWSGSPFDIPNIAKAFDRAALGEAYARVMQDPKGSVGDAMSVKLQSDYLAAQERAFRLRHLSSVRARVHAAARRRGHANDEFGIFARVRDYAVDLLVQGAIPG